MQMHSGLPRLCDVLLALLGLSVSLPILLIAGLAIRLTSKGPVLFSQPRVGLNGRLFKLYKLRTMRTSGQGLQVTASDDERITPVGRILRKIKADELPELWNVLKGEMAVVGPRPEVERYVDRENPDWKFVLKAKPGLTDPVTLQLRNEERLLGGITSDRDHFYREVLQPFKLKGYIDYLQHRSWQVDLKVLRDTAIAILLPSTVTPPTVDELALFSGTLPCRNR